jgi:protein O-mannosyl-transferase
VLTKNKRKPGEVESIGNTGARVWPRYAWQVATLWILAFVAYSNSFESGLVFDNAAVIGNDPRIRIATPETIRLIFAEDYWYGSTTSGLYRPLTTLSYLLNYTLLGDGPRPAGYHLVNLALHDLNILLVYMLGLVILGHSAPAFALAMLWALHPLLTESITNIVGRADLLAAFGILAGLLSHVSQASASCRKRLTWFATLIGAQTIGLFSKESAAILPAVMILYDVTWSRSQTWRDRVLPYAMLVLPFGAYLYLRFQLGTHLLVGFRENPLVGAGFWTGRITAVKVIGKFLWLFFWPVRLSADYSFNAVPLFGWRLSNWEDVKALIALSICGGLVVLAIRVRSRNKALFFFVGFFFIALAPTSNLVFPIGSIMAERFMYIPSFALCGCLIVAIQQLGRADLARMSPLWVVIAVICFAFGLRTYTRNFDWRDAASLWSSAVASCPESARSHYNLGGALLERSDFPNAIPQFEAALRIWPGYTYANLSLANALARVPGRTEEAVDQYEQALRLDPNIAEAHYNLGNVLARTPRRIPDAIGEWKAALRIRPDFAEAHFNLGTVYSQFPDRLGDAVAEYQAALQIHPDYVDAHNNLGNVLFRLPGRLTEAIGQYEQAIRLRPDLGEAHYRLGIALLQIHGRTPEAIEELEAAFSINPDPRLRRLVDELRARQR